MNRLISLGLAAFVAAAPVGWAQAQPIPVELWRGGDDGLSQHLFEAIEAAFAKAGPDFALSSGSKPGSLIILLPDHAVGVEDGRGYAIRARVTISTLAGEQLDDFSVNCLSYDFSDCTEAVLAAARSAASR